MSRQKELLIYDIIVNPAILIANRALCFVWYKYFPNFFWVLALVAVFFSYYVVHLIKKKKSKHQTRSD